MYVIPTVFDEGEEKRGGHAGGSLYLYQLAITSRPTRWEIIIQSATYDTLSYTSRRSWREKRRAKVTLIIVAIVIVIVVLILVAMLSYST